MWQKIKPYIISVLIALSVGGVSAFLTRGDMNLYESIVTPPLAPPGILFPFVWRILYILMGISAAMRWSEKARQPLATQNALYTYATSLVLNFAWSIIFFKFGAFLPAFIWLILLFVSIIATILKYRKIKPTAAYLQIPYAL